ncbi:hypothetical protein ACE1CI_22670 [Aerosakkonemataceae cyanobacterium BLCC-F50]|uniref:Uncharacterized protein n=1 Tax=Floridaenema flaviceps BLCC-F50 TaxID=3153642 RepID=A0ABV4XVG7_9CYAN
MAKFEYLQTLVCQEMTNYKVKRVIGNQAKLQVLASTITYSPERPGKING